MEEPSTEDNHTVKSAPQTAFVTSDTRQGSGEGSISAEIDQPNNQTTNNYNR